MASLQRLPIELQCAIALHLPLSALKSLLASSPQAFSNLHHHTIRRPGFCPWRRRYEVHRRAYEQAYREANRHAYHKRNRGNTEITNSAEGHEEARKKLPKELEYEALLVGYLQDLGFSNSEQEITAPRFLALNGTLLLRSVYSLWQRESSTNTSLRFQKTGVLLEDVRSRLDRICPLLNVGVYSPYNDYPENDGETAAVYYLLTIYLLYSSLKPDDVVPLLRSCTAPQQRADKAEDMEAAVCEYFCFLGLFLDILEGQTGLFDVGLALQQEEDWGDEGLFGPNSRRVLNGRLKSWLERRFAPTKPLLASEDDRRHVVLALRPRQSEPHSPEDAAPGSWVVASRSLSSSPRPQGSCPVPRKTGRSGPIKRSHSWGAQSLLTTLPMPTEGFRSSMGPRDRSAQKDTLTEEQLRVVNTHLRPSELMKVKAFAGTGKTRSLVEYAKRRPNVQFLYLAFNKNAQVDARTKFGWNVECKTMHALALRSLRHASPVTYQAMQDGRQPIPKVWGTKQLIECLHLNDERVLYEALEYPGKYRWKTAVLNMKGAANSKVNAPSRSPDPGIDNQDTGLQARAETTGDSTGPSERPTPTSVAAVVMTALERFWNSTDLEVSDRCLPSRMIERLGLKATSIQTWVTNIWTAILRGEAPWLPHDAYLKIMFLGEDTNADFEAFGKYEVILFDEAQDANACMASIILRQRSAQIAVIVVGDPYQRIYGFRGAGNDCFDDEKFVPSYTNYLTYSFRFGDQIAGVANTLLHSLDEPVGLQGVQPTDCVRRLESISVDDVREAAVPAGRRLQHHIKSAVANPQFTVIFRRNASVVLYALNFAITHPTYKLYLNIQNSFNKSSLFSNLRYAHGLFHHGHRVPSGPLSEYSSWEALKTHVEAAAAEARSESPILALVVGLEDVISEQDFLVQVDQCESNVLDEREKHSANVILVTTHQAKGLEWDRVQVYKDFSPDYEKRGWLCLNKFIREEMGLLYVAVTRARKELIIEQPVLAWITAVMGGGRYVIPAPPNDQQCTICHGKCLVWEDARIPGGSFSTVPMGPGGGIPTDTQQGLSRLVCLSCTPKDQVLQWKKDEVWGPRKAWAAVWDEIADTESQWVTKWARGL